MWLVNNSENSRILSLLDANIITPLLNLLMRAREENENSISSYYEELKESAFGQQIVRILKSKLDGRRVATELDRVLQNKDIRLDLIVDHYAEQKNQLQVHGPRAVTIHPVPAEIDWLFSEIFFGKFFNDDKLWQAVIATGYSKQIFISNFRADNNGLSACVYCDIDTCAAPGNCVIDHFLPQSVYPMLSVHPKNLLPICNSCNLPQTGKGKKVDSKASSPFEKQVGDSVVFSGIDSADGDIVLQCADHDESTSAYLSLLELPRRYAAVSSTIRTKVDSLLLFVTGQLPPEEELGFYLDRSGRTDGLYFARRYVLTNYSVYLKERMAALDLPVHQHQE